MVIVMEKTHHTKTAKQLEWKIKARTEVEQKKADLLDQKGKILSFESVGRDYRKEYDNYHAQPEQRERNAARKRARRQMEKAGKVEKFDKMDVHHKDNNPLNNEKNNLAVTTQTWNRTEPRLRKESIRKVDEAVGKFMTGEVGIKGKRVKVEVEVSGVDNKKRIYHAKVLAPKEHFGLELQIPAKVMHRGKWIKTETGKAFKDK